MEYTSIHRILDDLGDHPMLHLNIDSVVRYAVRFMRELAAPQILTTENTIVKIENHLGTLPIGIHQIESIVLVNRPQDIIMRPASQFVKHGDMNTYQIKGRAIQTAIKNGDLKVIYKAVPTDCDGFPMIPDDELFIDTLEAFIKWREFENLYDQGKLQQNQIANVKRNYGELVAQLMGRYNTPTTGEMLNIETIMGSTLYANDYRDPGYRFR